MTPRENSGGSGEQANLVVIVPGYGMARSRPWSIEGAESIALPQKICGGSGGPVRIAALVP